MIPLVSVITPTRNRNDILPTALHSFATSYPRIEWVVVDSSDKPEETVALVRTAEVENVVYIYRKQAPWETKCIIGLCRNMGVDAANGEYLTFADADDLQLPDKLSKAVPFLEAHPEYDAVFGNTQNEVMQHQSRACMLPMLENECASFKYQLERKSHYIGIDAFVWRRSTCLRVSPESGAADDFEYALRLGLELRTAYIDVDMYQSLGGRSDSVQKQFDGMADYNAIHERFRRFAK